MGVILRQVIGHARQARVHVSAAQVFRRNHLTCGRFDQGRTRKKNRALLFDDNRHIRHSRNISAPSRTRPHHNGDLRQAFGGHLGLIVKDSAKMVSVWEDLILIGQIGPAAIDQGDHGQMALLRDFLGAQMFFHGHRIVGTAFDRGVIANDHHVAPMHFADTGDEPSAGRRAIIHAMGCGSTNF